VIDKKDFGRLRVSLTNVAMLRGKDENHAGQEGIWGVKCDFVFTSLDTQRSYLLAQNAQVYQRNHYAARAHGIGQLIDSDGHVWQLIEHKGLSSVACTIKGNPTSIGRYISSGTHFEAFNDSGGIGGKVPIEEDATKWTGDLDTIIYDKPLKASLVFSVLDESGKSEFQKKNVSAFRLESQLVMGVPEVAGKDVKYSLERLVFDKIVVPKADSDAKIGK
jgi:hypothetical protein